jgi:hypothetical protein
MPDVKDDIFKNDFSRKRPAQNAQEIAMGEIRDVLRAPSARAQQIAQPAHVAYRVQVARGLFAAKAAVQIRAEAGVARVARYLTNMVDVLRHFFQAQAALFGGRLSLHPIGNEHPAVQRRADDRIAREQGAYLVVG